MEVMSFSLLDKLLPPSKFTVFYETICALHKITHYYECRVNMKAKYVPLQKSDITEA